MWGGGELGWLLHPPHPVPHREGPQDSSGIPVRPVQVLAGVAETRRPWGVPGKQSPRGRRRLSGDLGKPDGRGEAHLPPTWAPRTLACAPRGYERESWHLRPHDPPRTVRDAVGRTWQGGGARGTPVHSGGEGAVTRFHEDMRVDTAQCAVGPWEGRRGPKSRLPFLPPPSQTSASKNIHSVSRCLVSWGLSQGPGRPAGWALVTCRNPECSHRFTGARSPRAHWAL